MKKIRDPKQNGFSDTESVLVGCRNPVRCCFVIVVVVVVVVVVVEVFNTIMESNP